jgi:hypothetical protein
VQAAWRELAAVWNKRYGNVEILGDADVERLPADEPVWLLGWDNALVGDRREMFAGQGQRLDAASANLGGAVYDRSSHAVVVLDPDNARPPLGFVGADDVTVIRRLAGKLTHYGSFGRLAFALPGLENRLREAVGVMHSPLSRRFDDFAPALRLPPEKSLAESAGLSMPD